MKTASHPARSELRDAGAHIGLHARRCRLLHVRHVLEVVVALLDAGGPSEVVEREGRVAAFCEAEREFLVEAIEPADVGQDHDADARWLFG